MPDYDPNEHPERWLLGACSSGDPLRWAVVAVAEKVERQARHLRVWQQGFQETAAATQGELVGLRAPADPAKRLLSSILAIVNRHQGANPEQAMAEIHEVCAAFLDTMPAVQAANDGEA